MYFHIWRDQYNALEFISYLEKSRHAFQEKVIEEEKKTMILRALVGALFWEKSSENHKRMCGTSKLEKYAVRCALSCMVSPKFFN
jgi:hypothetical protein